MIDYKNPTPVAVVLVPVKVENDKVKLLLIKRPDTDKWALPGGFVNEGESIEVAAARELEEETGLVIKPRYVQLSSSVITPGNKVLVFCQMPLQHGVDTDLLVRNDEASDFCLWDGSTEKEFAFDLHKQKVGSWFSHWAHWLK